MSDKPKKNQLPVPYEGKGMQRPPMRELMYVDNGSPGLEGQIFLLMNAFNMGMDDASEIASFAKLNGRKGVLVSTFEIVETKVYQAREKRDSMASQYPELLQVDFQIPGHDDV